VADLVGGRVAPLGRWIWMGLSVGQSIPHERVVQDLMEAYGDSQTYYAVYKNLEQCKQQPKERVVEFKIRLEELFWTLEDEPSELAKTAKFVTSLLPALNRKLHGKQHSSLAHAVAAAQIEEWRLGEAERRTHREEWEQRAIMDKVASRKGASQRARAGKPWRGLKANVLTC